MASRTEQLDRMLEGFHTLKGGMVAGRRTLPSGMRLTGSQWIVLNYVAHHQSASIKEISTALGITSSAATQIVGELIKAGNAVRRDDPEDKRVSRISLSPKARKELSTMRKAMVRHLTTLFSALSDREFSTYMRLHAKIIHNARSS